MKSTTLIFAAILATTPAVMGKTTPSPATAPTPSSFTHQLSHPIAAHVSLRSPRQNLFGQLISYDDQTLTLRTRNGDQRLQWTDLTSQSAYALRYRLIDKKKATDWLELGRFGWIIDAQNQAKGALRRAVAMDPSLKTRADAILAAPAGSVPATQPSPPPQEPAKYIKSTPEQCEQALEAARETGQKIAAELKVTFTQISTPHFLIFTDWNPREYNFLKKNLEGAYAVVSRQFDIPVKDNVFVGKLPVYMFNNQKDFLAFAHNIDHFSGANERVAGYYEGRSDGLGHMAMWKPQFRQPLEKKEAERQWAYTLTHEFTHAFVARYRTNAHIPTWLNEGIAEVIASSQFPNLDRQRAADMARQTPSIQTIFSQIHPTGEWYPVMRTLVETLIARDRKAFLGMFDDIKEGMKPEEALKKRYGWTYSDLEKYWRRYVSQFEVIRG